MSYIKQARNYIGPALDSTDYKWARQISPYLDYYGAAAWLSFQDVGRGAVIVDIEDPGTSILEDAARVGYISEKSFQEQNVVAPNKEALERLIQSYNVETQYVLIIQLPDRIIGGCQTPVIPPPVTYKYYKDVLKGQPFAGPVMEVIM